MTFEKAGEMQFWMEVYVATSKNGDVAVPGLSERLADNAVKALRKRIPEERPSGDGPLWPSSMKRGML